MLPYWLLFSTFAFGAVTHRLTPRGAAISSPLFIGAAVLTALFIGLRYEVGADWFNYTAIYASAARLDVEEVLGYGDPAYIGLNTISHWLDLDIWFVNLCCGVIFAWGLVRFAQRQPNPWLTVAVAVPYLIIVVGMGYTRQAVAIGFMLAAFGPFERGRYGRFVVLMALATLFHKSAIIILPLIALSTVRHRLVVYTTAAAMGALIFFVYLDAFLNRVLQSYLDREMASDGAGVRVAMNVVPALLFLTFQDRFSVSDQEKTIWRNFSLASLAMVGALFLLPSSTVVDRAALYLMPIQLFVLARVPYAFPMRNGGVSSLLVAAVLAYSAAIQIVWLTFAAHADAWVPYQVMPIFS